MMEDQWAPFPLTEVDKQVLAMTDDEFVYHDWEGMKMIIRENNLSALKRKPSDLRRYMRWTDETKKHPVSPIVFRDPADYQVLINDWPYGLTPDITHMVVWCRGQIATDAETGDMTTESRNIISEFVRTFFTDKLGLEGASRVLWFKNWTALQSVRTLEHIHVLVRNVGKDQLDGWTTIREPRRP